MTHDIVIRDGDLVDGTGNEPVRGDLAIDDGVITAMGDVSGSGREEIDAAGHVVTPGFVDIHTHLDAQIGWDPGCTPVSWHGVTTVLLGNCGVTFAPCKPDDRELLAGMMETVEDIPKDAILGGLPWDWEDYGGYLDAIDRLRPGLNVAGLIGHCALRFYVMGERAVEEQATEEEKQEMAALVGAAIDAGAVGFSTNRFPPHVLPDGRSIPGTFADPSELMAIAKAVGARDALMQNVLDWGGDPGTYEMVREMARTSGGRVLFSFGVGESTDGAGAVQVMETIGDGGLDISAVTQPRGSGWVMGLQGLLPVGGSVWREFRQKGFDDRLAAIADPDYRHTLIEAAKTEKRVIDATAFYYMGDGESPRYAGHSERDSLAALAEQAGEHWSETFLRLSLETKGKALFTYRMFNVHMDALERLLQNDHVFPILGDAGAHVSQIMDAGWSSFVLSHWVREKGLFSMGDAIRRMTSAPARIIGLADRGTLAPGMRADVNVIDPDAVAELHPEIVHDFPGGAPRFIQRSKGYRATLVNGRVNVRDGELTGERAGGVLRHRA